MPMLVGTQKVGRYLNTKLSRNEEISRVEQQNELLLCRRGARTMQVTKPLKHYILHCYCHSNAPNYRKKLQISVNSIIYPTWVSTLVPGKHGEPLSWNISPLFSWIFPLHPSPCTPTALNGGFTIDSFI